MSGKTIWKDEFVFVVYDLARGGMIERKMAKVLGISLETFRRWESKKKQFRMAVKRGRKFFKKEDGSTFSLHDYVHGRLPEDLKETWDKINRCDTLKNGVERLEAILSKGGKSARQGLFFHSFLLGNFSLSSALRRINISRSTFELWKKDPEFLRLFEECSEIKGDFFEEHLITLIAGGCVPATIAANQTYNRKRGYGQTVDVEVSGEIRHNVISIDAMKLTLKERKWLLSKVRNSTLELQKANQMQMVKQIESKAV